ncbi:MAG: hypothetical protein RL199_973 [Pseudomonadota bacterium]|jgi:hypothetical protein
MPTFRRLLTGFMPTLLLLAACECGSERRLKDAGGQIEIDPAEVTLVGTPGEAVEVDLKVSNTGGSPLTVGDAPSIVEKDADGVTEYAVSRVFDRFCDGRPRPASQKGALAPGDCAVVTFRYAPVADGKDDAEFHFYSDDAARPDFVVPITAAASTPMVEVCAYDGTTLIDCAVPGADYVVDLGRLARGESSVRTLKITSSAKATRALAIADVRISGDPDVAVTPLTLPPSLAVGDSVTLTTTFSPQAGGLRETDLVVATDDPVSGRRVIRLVGTGDMPRLCVGVCDQAEGGRCTSNGTADFGRVPVDAEATKYLRLSSCGTKPLILSAASLTEGAPVFAAQSPNLSPPLELKPRDPNDPTSRAEEVVVPLSFRPPAEDVYSGRFVVSTNAESGTISLRGDGLQSGCKLEGGSSILDFGQVAQTYTGRRDYTVANRGNVECVLAGDPVITAGSTVAFALDASPAASTVIAPGQTARFTLSYTPADANGPDEGEVAIPYAANSAGSALVNLRVRLVGTPSDKANCVLVAQPGPSSTLGNNRALNFGQVKKGTEKELPVTFQNAGSLPCNINGATVSGGPLGGLGGPSDASYFRIKSAPAAVLQPGDSTSIVVGFSPDAARAYGSDFGSLLGGALGGFGLSLQVNTSDTVSFNGSTCGGGFLGGGGGSPGCVAWALSGQGVSSDLSVLPGDLDFGKVTLGCNSRRQRVTLYNTGFVPMTLKSFKVDPVLQPVAFKVIGPATPFTLAGGAQVAFEVVYRPSAEGLQVASLLIESDATNVTSANPYVTVGLKGEGTTETHATDRFDQNTRPKTDVLLVVDNSGSMKEEQTLLGDNAQKFLDTAAQLNSDFHVAVVTTDMSDKNESGRFQTHGGAPKVVVNGPTASASLKSTVQGLGIGGSFDEQGLAAMVAALSVPLIKDPQTNAGFLRTDAKLAVVVVSDEEDSSPNGNDFYVDFLENIKGQYNRSLVTLSAIVGDEYSGCKSSNGTADPGNRYIDVANRTGGKVRSICASDWGQIASDLGLDAFSSRAGFALSRLADPGSIQVTVAGQVSPAGHWSYDANANAVVFAAGHIPGAGAAVVIDYDTLCL